MNKIKKILLVLLIAFLSAFLFSCYYKKNGAKNYQHIFKYDSDLGYGEHKYNSYLLLFPRETPKTLVEFHYETVIALDVDCYGIYFICKLSKENYDAFIYGLDNFVVKYGEGAFEFLDDFIKVTIPFDEEVMAFVPNVTKDVTKDVTKTDEQIIIELIKENPTITISEMAKVINKSTRTVQRIINASKCITRIGSKYNGYWEASE